MEHQSLAGIPTEEMAPGLHPSQKHNLRTVIGVRPNSSGMRPLGGEMQPVEEELQQDLHHQQMHRGLPGVGEELRLGEGGMQTVGDEQTAVDGLTVANEDTLTMDGEMTDMEQNQDVQVIAHQANLLEDATGVINSDKIKLPGFSNQQNDGHDPHDLQLGGITSGSSSLPLDAQHYYESLHPAPIMVYEVAASNIVPFDSLVSVPLGKAIGEKGNEGVDLLQASVGETVYAHPQQNMSHPLYVLHQPQKKESSEGMVIEQVNTNDGVSPNIVLENQDDGNFSKVPNHGNGVMPIGSEFSLISTSCYDSSVTTVANMAHLSMSAVYHSSTDTDSEVALTLASLGNPKHEKMDREMQIQSSEASDVIRAASIISGVTATHQQFEGIHHQASSTLDHQLQKKSEKPTLVLRSRRSRGTAPSQHHQDLMADEGKKVNRRKKKKDSRLASFPKSEDSDHFIIPDIPGTILPVRNTNQAINLQNESQKENLLGQLLKASEHCEPATLIPEGVVDDVIPAVGYRIMDMSNLSEMIKMMHRCTGTMGAIVIQEQASLREGAVSQLSVICTGCQEGAVCATSNRTSATGPWDINARVEQLTKEFNIKEDQVQRMLEILGIFYRPCDPSLQPVVAPMEVEVPSEPTVKKKRKRKTDTDSSGKPKNLVCTVCKERFVGENHLKKHMHSHDLSLHTCPYCHAYFKKPFNLKQHIKKHENCKYECTQCQRLFTDKSTLLCHIRSQHEKRYNIQCEVCLKRFYHRQHYNEHMRIHTGEKPYMCELCGKKFSWHDSVKKHMQTHSAESKYKCRLCGKWFRWLQGVRQHLQQQHKLKKCDIEAQVVTAATETASNLPQYHQPQQQQQQLVHNPTQQQQSQHSHDQSQQHQLPHNQTPQQQQQESLPPPSGQDENSTGREYHTLEAAAPSSENNGQPSLNMFHVEVEGQTTNMFQYH